MMLSGGGLVAILGLAGLLREVAQPHALGTQAAYVGHNVTDSKPNQIDPKTKDTWAQKSKNDITGTYCSSQTSWSGIDLIATSNRVQLRATINRSSLDHRRATSRSAFRTRC